MNSIAKAKKILLIDDDLSIRFVLQKLIYDHFPEDRINIDVYTSSSGPEGLGLVYSINPDVIILDTSLPDYDGQHIIEYVDSNQDIKEKNAKVIVLTDNYCLRASNKYVLIDKRDPDFIKKVLDEVAFSLSDEECFVSTKYERMLAGIGSAIIGFSDKANTCYKSYNSTDNSIQKLKLAFSWIFYQILQSIVLTLFYITAGRKIYDSNFQQKREDKYRFNRRYYPTLAIVLAIIMLSTIRVGVFTATSLGFFSSGIVPVQAATRTWDGEGSTNNWSECANWSSNTCPLTTDIVVFDGTSSKNVTIDASAIASILTMNVNSGYGGTITQARTFTISNLVQSAGSYNTGSQTLTLVNFTLSGGTFTASSATTNLTGNLTVSGSGVFNANGGTFALTSQENQTLACNNITFNLVSINKTVQNNFLTIGSDCNLPLGNNPTVIVGTADPNTLTLNGTLTGTGTLTIHNQTSQFNLSSTSVLSGFSGLVSQAITNNGMNADWSSYTTFTINGAVTLTSGSFVFPAPTGTGINMSALTISAGSFTASPGNMNISGNITFSPGSTFNANGGSITLNGSADATLACNNATFNLVNIAKTSQNNDVIVGADCNLPLGNNPSIVTGTAAPNSLTLNGTLTGSGTITFGSASSNFNLVSTSVLSGFSGLNVRNISVTGFNADFGSYSTFSVNGSVAIASGGNLVFPAGTFNITTLSLTGGSFTASPSNMNVSSNITFSAGTSFNANGGTITLNGTTDATLACNNAVFNLIVISKTNQSNDVIVGSDCSLPLGNNPTITTGTSAPNTLTVNGALTGSGTLTFAGESPNFNLNSGSVLSGFTGLNAQGINIAGYNADFSSFSPFSMSGSVTVSSGNLAFPAGTFNLSGINITGGSFTASPSNMNLSGNLTLAAGTTFNANSGTITLTGTSSQTLSCNNSAFNLFVINKTNQNNTVTVGADCNIPLGNNPSISIGTSSPNTLLVNGTISGSGTISMNATSTLNLPATAVVSGFSGFNVGGLTIAGANADFSAYSTAIVNTAFSLTSGTFTAPAGTFTVNGSFTRSGGTFNANSGTVNFAGGTATLSCGSATFSLVTFTGQTNTKTVSSNCTLPLGSNPVIPNSIILTGVLSGSGTATISAGTLTLNAGASFTGLTGLSVPSLTVSGAAADFSSFTTFNVTSTLTMSSGTFTGPGTDMSIAVFNQTGGTFNAPSGTMNVSGQFTFSGGTFVPGAGTVNFNGGGATINCGTITFNKVGFTGQTGIKTINSNCTLPLGNNPLIDNGINLSGTLTGTGTITHTTGTLTFNSTAAITGFTGMTGTSNSLTIGASANLNMSSFTDVTFGGSYTQTAAATTFTAPSGVLTVNGNFTRTTGTFNHNNGTFNLGSGSQTITGSTTFYNFTKELSSASPQTLTFPASGTQTVLGSLTLKGYNSLNRLLLRSSSTNTRWNIDPQGTRDMLYLDVRDGNNTNASVIQMGGTGSFDSGNNINFNFGSIVPNNPTSLGPASSVSGTLIGDSTPQLRFTLSDPNLLDTVSFRVQVSTASDFSTLIVDYTSQLESQGNKLFIVGQPLDGGTYTVGSEGQSLVSGNYYWRVNVTDNNGLTSGYSTANGGSIAFILDIDAPDPFTPTLNVSSPTNNQTPEISFSTTDNVMIDHYEISINSGAFVDRSSPYTFPTMAEGDYEIVVRAFDTAGNFRDGTMLTFTVDLSLPDPFTPTFNVSSPTSNTTPEISFVTSDTQGIDRYELEIDGGGFSVQVSPYETPVLSEGTHNFTVRAFDNAGNYRDSSVSLIIDLTPPDNFSPMLSVSSPTNTIQPELSFTTNDSNGIDYYQVKIDSGAFASQTSPYTLPALAEGNHTFQVRAFDNAGNFTDSSAVNLIVDLTAPAVFVPTLNVTSPTANTTPEVSFVTTDNISVNYYQVQVDGLGFTTQTSPYLIPAVDDGLHTIYVRAYDSAGNMREGSISFTVDTGAPEPFTLSFNESSPTNNVNPEVSFSTTDDDGINRYEVSIDSSAFVVQVSPYQIPSLTDGSHSVTVRAFDNAGNYRDASSNIVIDTQPPDTFIPELFDGTPTNDINPVFSYSTSDNIAIDHYEVSIDSGSFVVHSSPFIFNTAGEGLHNITVRAFDTAGNSRDGSLDFFVDHTNPIINFNAPTKISDLPITDTTLIVTDNNGIAAGSISVSSIGEAACNQISAIQVNCTITIDESGDLTVNATDQAGNLTQIQISDYIIDLTAPVIVINAPTKTNSVTITDTTIQIIDNYQIDFEDVSATGGVLSCLQTSVSEVNCAATVPSSGDLVITAIDLAGNTSIQTEADYEVTGAVPEPFNPILNTDPYTTNTSPEISFTTFDNDGIDRYELSIDGGPYNVVTSPYTLPALSEGSHTITVRAFDIYNNFTAGVTTVTIDLTAPESFTTSVIGTPVTNNTRPIITFGTTDNFGIDHYEVQVDSGFFTIESSPHTLPILSDGPHIITVRAVDRAGNITTSSLNLTVDTTPPAAFTPTLNVTSPTTNQNPILSFSTTDNVGIDHYEVQIDSLPFSTQVSPYDLPTQTSGSHLYTVIAYDQAGNSTSGSVALIVDLNPPTINIVAPTKVSNQTITDTVVTISDLVGVDISDVTITGASANCSQLSAIQVSCSTSMSASGDINVAASDLAGNATSAEELGYVIETTPPVIQINAPLKTSSASITNTTISITDNYQINVAGVSAVGGTILCSQISVQEVGCTSSISQSGDLEITAVDRAGNNATETETGYQINATGPAAFTPKLNTPYVTNIKNPVVTFATTAPDGIARYELLLDSGNFVEVTSPHQLPDLAEGYHQIIVRAYSNSNQFIDGFVAVIIDNTAPDNLSLQLNIKSPTNNPEPIATFAARDTNGIDKYEIKVESAEGQFVEADSPYTIQGIEEGEHKVTLRVVDKAGNNAQTLEEFLLDTTPPTGTLLINGNQEFTNNFAVTLTISGNDNLTKITQMKVSDRNDFANTDYGPFASSIQFKLQDKEGEQKVYLRLKDEAGNESDVIEDAITLTYGQTPTNPDPQSRDIDLDVIPQVLIPVLLASSLTAAFAANIVTYPRFLIYGMFILRRKKKNNKFGIIYDIETKLPIPFVTVRVKRDSDNTQIAEQITDLNGKYGFILDSGKYKLEVVHSDYAIVEEVVELEQKESEFGMSIGLGRTENSTNGLREKISRVLSKYNKYLVTVGFVVSIIAVIWRPVPHNIAILILYLLQTLWLIYNSRKDKRTWGIISEANSKLPLGGVFVRLYSIESGRQIDVAVSDKKGRYKFNVAEGEYLISADLAGYKMELNNIEDKNIFKGKVNNDLIKVSLVKDEKLVIDISLKRI